MTEKIRKGWIESDLYRQVTASMPILCVDLVIRRKDGLILLVKRRNYPAKNRWWTPGGKVDKGEKLEKAVIRIAEEKVGISVRILKQIGVFEFFFRKGHFGNPSHIVSIVFLVVPINYTKEVNLDYQSSAHRWVSKPPKHIRWAKSLGKAST